MDKIALSLTVKKTLSNFVICHFWQKIKMAIFGNFSKSLHSILLRSPGVKIFDEITLSLTVKEIEAIL